MENMLRSHTDLMLPQPCCPILLEWVPAHQALGSQPSSLCVSPPAFPLTLLLWALHDLPFGIPLKTHLTFRQCPSWFCAGYDWSFFNNFLSMSPQPIVSSAHNQPAAFCPLRVGKLETCNSSHSEWEVSLAFQPKVCTEWQFSGGLGGAFPV